MGDGLPPASAHPHVPLPARWIFTPPPPSSHRCGFRSSFLSLSTEIFFEIIRELLLVVLRFIPRRAAASGSVAFPWHYGSIEPQCFFPSSISFSFSHFCSLDDFTPCVSTSDEMAPPCFYQEVKITSSLENVHYQRAEDGPGVYFYLYSFSRRPFPCRVPYGEICLPKWHPGVSPLLFPVPLIWVNAVSGCIRNALLRDVALSCTPPYKTQSAPSER